MDGRYEEVYYDYMIPLLKKFFLVNNGWDEAIEKYPPNVLIIEKSYPVYKKLQEDDRYTLAYSGDYLGVFVDSKNKKESYKTPPQDLEYYQQRLFDTDINFMLKSSYE